MLNIIIIVGFVILAGLIVLVYRRLSNTKGEDAQYTVLNQRLDAMSNAMNQQMTSVSSEVNRRLESTGNAVSQGLRDTLQLVQTQLKESRESAERSTMSVHQQVQSFTKGMTELQETVKQVQDSVKDVVSFQEIFRSPKLRGSWGELSLESVLQQYFTPTAYESQYSFSSGEIVDAVLKLPSGQLLPIDSKFNWENFQKMSEAQDSPSRMAYRKQFMSDVKKRIDEIATKYIIPAEDTTDMALMYMPAEAIYYEVIQNLKEDDVSEYARKRKVLLTSPNTLYITLTAILHWYKDVQVQKQTKQLMKKIQEVIRDAGVLEKDFEKLGGHLSDATSAFERTDHKLRLMTERAQKVIEIGESEEVKKLERSPEL